VGINPKGVQVIPIPIEVVSVEPVQLRQQRIQRTRTAEQGRQRQARLPSTEGSYAIATAADHCDRTTMNPKRRLRILLSEILFSEALWE